jgi:hypothetical protein
MKYSEYNIIEIQSVIKPDRFITEVIKYLILHNDVLYINFSGKRYIYMIINLLRSVPFKLIQAPIYPLFAIYFIFTKNSSSILISMLNKKKFEDIQWHIINSKGSQLALNYYSKRNVQFCYYSEFELENLLKLLDHFTGEKIITNYDIIYD